MFNKATYIACKRKFRWN